MVDGYVSEKCYMYALLWVNAFIWSWHVLVAWLCLICGWITYFDHMEPKAHLPSWMFSPMLYLVEGISSFLSQRHFMYQIWIWKWNVNCLENVLTYHMCLIQFTLGAKSLHDAYQWEVSYIEVGSMALTWHEVLVGVCDSLMIRMVVLVWSLCSFAILICFAHV
jgi:hypothetical protein